MLFRTKNYLIFIGISKEEEEGVTDISTSPVSVSNNLEPQSDGSSSTVDYIHYDLPRKLSIVLLDYQLDGGPNWC